MSDIKRPPANGLLPAVSRETRTRLDQFHALFRSWSARLNLTAASTVDAFWTRHVADSAQLRDLKPDARRWADLGSGAGFPGLVIAILLSDKDDGHVDLIESNRKKAAFLQVARTHCAPAARVHAERIETALPKLAAPEIVTARALAPLSRLLEMAAPWLVGDTVGLFHKGRGYRNELEESRAQWSFDLLEHQSAVEPGSVVLEIARLRRKS